MSMTVAQRTAFRSGFVVGWLTSVAFGILLAVLL